jgi:hypothetical protein
VPQVLRLWAAALVIGCAALLTMTIVGFARLTDQVDTIGAEAAPQAATASDIYFALSDLDAQAATLLMLGDARSLSLNRLSALATFQQRTAEVDTDLAQANRGATDAAQRALLGRIADELSLYRQWVWRAIDAQQGSIGTAPVDAVPPPGASLGLYAEATTVLRTGLLPDVEALRQTNEDRLDAAYASLKTTAIVSIVGVLALGVLLVVALVRFQFRLSRWFRRTVNPALLVATVAVATLVATASVAFLDGSVRMHDAQRDQFAPYLSLTRLQAVSYDAVGDASRYLIASDPKQVNTAMRAKTACVNTGRDCPPGTSLPDGGLTALTAGIARDSRTPSVVDRWTAYQKDRDRVVSLADTGQRASAVGVLTGISQGGGAAIDMLLVLAGVRPRLSEYR